MPYFPVLGDFSGHVADFPKSHAAQPPELLSYDGPPVGLSHHHCCPRGPNSAVVTILPWAKPDEFFSLLSLQLTASYLPVLTPLISQPSMWPDFHAFADPTLRMPSLSCSDIIFLHNVITCLFISLTFVILLFSLLYVLVFSLPSSFIVPLSHKALFSTDVLLVQSMK